ncbi:MAG TPA: hypothetical protein VL856_19875 [Acidimicrobiia bacterium]|jgi:hypothetical protein|nr:hypothetical protein [Acidimicrobiia bacterium]
MKSDSALDALWELEGRLTDSAGSMEKEAAQKSLSGPAAERLANKADGVRMARTLVWDAIRERTKNGSSSNGGDIGS